MKNKPSIFDLYKMKEYVLEVKSRAFPDEDKHCYHMVKGEAEKFKILMK